MTSSNVPSQEEALDFLWSGQRGYVGLFRDPIQIEQAFFNSPAQAIRVARQFTYFTPVPLLEKRALKDNVVPRTNLLWIEADAPDVLKHEMATPEQIGVLREHRRLSSRMRRSAVGI